jgi:16S rRNA (cytosine967-C5)-methyltransferase
MTAPVRRPPPSRRRPADGGTARRAAFDVLAGVQNRDAYANLLLPSVLKQYQLAGRDAALATELAYGTLRGQGSYDAILAICSARSLDQVDAPVRLVLRLGAHQLLATRIRPHAAVDTSVDLAREVAGARTAGFVNAVLRKVATRDLPAWLDIAAPPRSADPVGHLAIRHSHPAWIVAALRDALGESDGNLAETERALAADSARPRVTLCAVPGLASPDDLAAAGAEPARWSPYGGYLAEGNPADLAVVAQRRAGVQDEASQLAALALTRADLTGDRDQRWLDTSAGPGGKARLLAADVRPHRAALVAAATASTGRAAVVVADGTAPAWPAGAFDRVLADVPCSGLGALRRRPEARWRRSPQDVTALAGLQRGLLSAALDAARPGGVTGYVTCSPHLAETRDVLAAVLASHPGTEVLDAPALLPDVPGLRCADQPRYAQFWPHRHGTDAIFVALLRRR